MKRNYIYNTFYILLIILVSHNLAKAQINCNTLDINKVPGKWVWNKGGYGTQWQFNEPIRKELQRIMPVALEGLFASNNIAFGGLSTIPNSVTAPKYYENNLMLKKFECLKGSNILQPEGVTGCWVYFVVNSIFQGGASFQDALHFGYYANEGAMYTGDFYTEKDANGNRILYASTFSKANQKKGHYFSLKESLPIRKVTWKELIMSYKTYSEKEIGHKLTFLKEGLAKNEKELLTTKYDDTKKYLTNLIADRKLEIKKWENDKTVLQNWYTNKLQHKRINEIAKVKNIRLVANEIDNLLDNTSDADKYPVWIDDNSFYDAKKSKDLPQCILLSIRRQDNHLPKKNFMDLFYSQFNLDVLAKLVGEPVKKPNALNTLDASLNEEKTTTKINQSVINNYNYNFEQSVVNEFPVGWDGMKNIATQQFENKKWLALTKDGYWYPQQYNKELKDNFSLSFDLSWNKDIAYNSGLFTVSFCDIPFDNAAERYKTDENQNQYWSLYDSYVGKFNRVMVWLDPYWNGGGTVEVYSYDKNESIGTRKRITLPDFYMAKNNHRIKLQRKGNSLVILINDKQVADIEKVFIPEVRYNLHTFSRYKGNNSDNKNDVFLFEQHTIVVLKPVTDQITSPLLLNIYLSTHRFQPFQRKFFLQYFFKIK